MNKKFVDAALKLICKEYLEEKKSKSVDLSNYRFEVDIFLKRPLAEFLVKNNLEYDMDLLLSRLEENGFIKSEYEQFQLTEQGNTNGTTTIFDTLLGWLNNNPGLISALSLAVSICALFVSLKR